jgi:hypothetical protein
MGPRSVEGYTGPKLSLQKYLKESHTAYNNDCASRYWGKINPRTAVQQNIFKEGHLVAPKWSLRLSRMLYVHIHVRTYSCTYSQ